jgi:hypothetical protein
MKSALKPNIGKRILNEVVAVELWLDDTLSFSVTTLPQED